MFKISSRIPALALLIVSGAGLLAQTPKSPRLAKPGKAVKSAVKTASLAEPVKITSVEGITEYRLANGLRVLLFPDPGKPTITVNITYLVGSRNENYGETGMAHLLEHLLFKGTPRHRDIPKELTEHGARPNGGTSYDRTNYFESFQATDENLKWALELEADRMVNSFISKKDLWNPETQKGEMSVVRNEFEMGENQASAVTFERVLETAFLWHNYGKPTIGCKADIENVNEARLQAFYRTYYQPDNAVLTVAGKVDEAKVLKQINRIFGGIPKPTRTLQPTYTAEPTQDGERQVVVRRVGDAQWAAAGYHAPAGSDPDFAALEVLTQAMSDTPTGRLHKALVESKRATAVFGGGLPLREGGYLIFGAQVPKDGKLDEAKELLLQQLEDPAKLAFTKEDVERAKTQLLNQIDLSLNDADRVGLALSEAIALGDWRIFFLDRDRIKAVGVDDVDRVAKAYLKPSNRTLGLFIPTDKPDRAEIPALKDVAAMLKDYKGHAAVSQGELFDASPAAIESRTAYGTLTCGAKVAVIAKKSRGGSVNFNFRFNLGDEKSLNGKATVASLVAPMLQRGTLKHSRAEIADLFDKAKTQIQIQGGVGQVIVSGETTKEHIAEVISILSEIMKEPAFPEKEFEILKQEMLAGIEEQRSDPMKIAPLMFSRLMNPYPKGHPRYVDTLEEQAESVKSARLEDVKAFHSAFFGASSADFAIVGDVDAKQVQRQLEDAFGTWKSPTAWSWVARRYQPVAAQTQKIETPDKANAFFIAGHPIAVQDTDPDFAALTLGDFMLGGGFLNGRLATRIREHEGLSYMVASQLQVSALEQAGMWVGYAIHAPQNLARLEAAFREEMDKALKTGFTAEEIKAAKNGLLQGRQVSRSQDGELAGRLAGNLQNNRTLAYDKAFEKQISDLTNEQIVAALRKHLDPSTFVIVEAGDFAKSANKK